MKARSLFITLLCLAVLAFVATASSEMIYVDTETGGTATDGAGIPAVADKYTVLYSLHAAGDALTVDLVFYKWSDEIAYLLNAEAAAQTALTINECGSMADGTALFIQDDNNPALFDFVVMSACNDSTNVATVAAIDTAFSAGAVVFEMTAANTYADWGSAAAGVKLSSDKGIFMGKETGKPIGVMFNGSGGKIFWVSGGSLSP